MPEAVVNDVEVGLIATSTGTTDAVRVEARRVSAGEDVDAAELLIAQYPARPTPGPRITTWPGICLLFVEM